MSQTSGSGFYDQFVDETYPELLRFGYTGSTYGGFDAAGTTFRITDGQGTESVAIIGEDTLILRGPNSPLIETRLELTGGYYHSGSFNQSGDMTVTGTGSFGFLQISNPQFLTASAHILTVYSQSNFYNDINISGSTEVTGNLYITGAINDVYIDVFSSSAASEINELQAGSSSFWTGSSNGTISHTGQTEITGDLVVDGTIYAEEFHTEFVSSSIIFESGSTKFGDDVGDRHDITGSLNVSNSINLIGTASVTGTFNMIGTMSVDGTVTSDNIVQVEGTASYVDQTRVGGRGSGSEYEIAWFKDANEIDSTSSLSYSASLLTVEGAVSSSGNINGVDIAEFSASTATEINDLQATASRNEATASSHESRLDNIDASGSTGLGLWTGSANGDISRLGDTYITGNLDVYGTLFANEFHTTLVSSSIIFESGSTKFGDTQDDHHAFTGSVGITGSLAIDGELVLDDTILNLEKVKGYHATESWYGAFGYAQPQPGIWTGGGSFRGLDKYAGLATMSITVPTSGSYRLYVQGVADYFFNGQSPPTTPPTAHLALKKIGGSPYSHSEMFMTFDITVNGSLDVHSSIKAPFSFEVVQDLLGGDEVEVFQYGDINFGSGDVFYHSMSLYYEEISRFVPQTFGDSTVNGDLDVTGTGSFGHLAINETTISWADNAVNALTASYISSVESASYSQNAQDYSSSFQSRFNLAEASISRNESTASNHETRIDDLEASASLNAASASILYTSASLNAQTASLNAFSCSQNAFSASQNAQTGSDHESRIDALELITGSQWTGSADGTITRDSNVEVTGALFVSSSDDIAFKVIGDTEITGNVDIAGIVTVQELHTQYQTSSVIFSSGSTKFGDTSDDRHEFTGSLELTGSFPTFETENIRAEYILYLETSASAQFTASHTESGLLEIEYLYDETLTPVYKNEYTYSIDVISGLGFTTESYERLSDGKRNTFTYDYSESSVWISKRRIQ